VSPKRKTASPKSKPKAAPVGLFPAAEYDIRLARLDPHGNHPGLTPRQRATAEATYGVSVKDAKKHYGRILDQAYADADPGPQSHAVTLAGEVEVPKASPPSAAATKERRARGVHAEGEDWYEKERIKHHNLSQKLGIPRNRISAARAAVAQNISESKELPSVEHVANQLKRGVPAGQVKGFGYHTNARKAAQILEGTATNKDLPGHKPPAFDQMFETHGEKWVRPPMDRHMLRAGAPHLSNDEISGIQASLGRTKSQGAVAPVHRILEEGLRQAAEARGMSAAEAQPVVWFPALRASKAGTAERRAAKNTGGASAVAPAQPRRGRSSLGSSQFATVPK